MLTSDPNEAALEWIRSAIAEERPQLHPDDIALLALTLDAIAEDYSVPVEECIVWIHSATFDENPETWRIYARAYAELQRRLCGGGDAAHA